MNKRRSSSISSIPASVKEDEHKNKEEEENQIKHKIDLDDPEVSFYKSSYFNPSTIEHKYDTLRSTKAKGIKWINLNKNQQK